MTFFHQVFWLIIILLNLYIIILRFTLPSLAFSLKSRHKKIKIKEMNGD